jgi:hypothetical protein
MASSLTNPKIFHLTEMEEKMIEKTVRNFERETWQEFKKACEKHRDIFAHFWKAGERKTLIGIRPYGVFFAFLLWRYLYDECKIEDLVFLIMDKDGYGLNRSILRGTKVVLVDDDIITGRTCREATEVIKSHGVKQTLYVVWEDHLGLANIVLSPSSGMYVDKYVASLRLGIHPESFSRLCREGRIQGAERIGKRWVIRKDALDVLAETYSPPPGGRPKSWR